MFKIDVFHPTLNALLNKLANPKFSVRDCSSERLDWVKAGCPIYTPEAALRDRGPVLPDGGMDHGMLG